MKRIVDAIQIDGTNLLKLATFYLRPEDLGEFRVHHELELSFVKSGSGQYAIDGKIYGMQEGDVFVLNNIESHTICHIDPQYELINTVIMFDPRFVWSIEGNFFDSRYLSVFFERGNTFQNKLDRDHSAAAEIRRLFSEIEAEFRNKSSEYELMIKVKLLNILVALTRYYGYSKTVSQNPSRRKQGLALLNKVMQFIDSNIGEPLHLEDIAVQIYMNPSYFSTFFKKMIGISPMEYLARQRIKRAIEYLKNSDKTILEISSLCGFNSTANFYKTFKKCVGKVPSDFRTDESSGDSIHPVLRTS